MLSPSDSCLYQRRVREVLIVDVTERQFMLLYNHITHHWSALFHPFHPQNLVHGARHRARQIEGGHPSKKMHSLQMCEWNRSWFMWSKKNVAQNFACCVWVILSYLYEFSRTSDARILFLCLSSRNFILFFGLTYIRKLSHSRDDQRIY